VIPSCRSTAQNEQMSEAYDRGKDPLTMKFDYKKLEIQGVFSGWAKKGKDWTLRFTSIFKGLEEGSEAKNVMKDPAALPTALSDTFQEAVTTCTHVPGVEIEQEWGFHFLKVGVSCACVGAGRPCLWRVELDRSFSI
jgi:hypothetical protein